MDDKRRYVVMGVGEVGLHLARTLSQHGHSVVVIEIDPIKRTRVEEELDVAVVGGNGAHVPVLKEARVATCDLFMAVSSSDEANLAAAVLARRLGAKRTVVRVGVAEDITTHRQLYEEVFGADLLLSTQLLATTHILNHILGHNTVAVEYLAQGKVQLRKIHLDDQSPLTRRPLREIELPEGCLVVAFQRGDELTVPSGDDVAQPGDDALILASTEVIGDVERRLSSRPRDRKVVVIAGGGRTGETVAQALLGQSANGRVERVKLIERDLRRAQELAAQLPGVEVLHGDATDVALLRAEDVPRAQVFVALTGQDERNLMASLLARELGVPQVVALVQRGETSYLWRKLGLMEIVSPRAIAYQRIKEYVDQGYSANLVSLERGAAEVLERRLHEASPAAGVTLAEFNPPRGVIVGAVVRGERVFVPRGKDRLEAGDTVILFVQKAEMPTINLLFPGREAGAR
ncbi:MAG: Trk system potassium transporter TrkA [Acidobacteria bacterium]|nr:MAG: Trk system potassium transporter TrkA [Acidobacteriota bacterium]